MLIQFKYTFTSNTHNRINNVERFQLYPTKCRKKATSQKRNG